MEQNYGERYVNAWQNANITQLLAVIKDDAILTMPSLAGWYKGHAGIRYFITEGPISVAFGY